MDDEPNARSALAELLAGEGFQVETAADGVKALEKFETFAPHLVVTDLIMPEMDGLELTRRLRAFERPPAVVVMTANNAVTSAVNAMRAGAADYLSKPIHFDELLIVTERVLEHQQLWREAIRAHERVREQLGFTSAMQSSIGEGTLAVDLDGLLTFINATGAELLGGSDLDMLGRRCDEVFRVETADGASVECPLGVAVRTGTRVRSEDHLIVRADGSRFHATYTATPIRRDGRVTGAVVAFDDISERRQAQEDEAFLLDAGVKLSASLDSSAVAAAVARLGVPRLADLCFVDVVAGEDRIVPAAWAHADPAGQGELDRVFAPTPRTPVLAKPVADVVATGRTKRLAVHADAWFSLTDVPAALRLGIRRAVVVPIELGARRIGALTLAMTGDRRHAGRDIALAEELARRSASALEHARLYEEACRAVALRDQTLAIVSHDLRSPLQTIMLAGGLLREEAASAKQPVQATAVEKIQTAADRMNRMIGDLLDFASIDAGKLSVVARPHPAAAILDEAVTSFEAAAKSRQVKLTAQAPTDLPPIPCDRDRILQVIGNLVGNALRVVPTGGSVSLSVRASVHEAVFSVADTGPGIAAEDQARLFDRFWRSSDVKYKGTGLGLAIAQGIVQAHHGRIWVDSELGRGATFSFTVPLLARVGDEDAPGHPRPGARPLATTDLIPLATGRH